MWTIIPALILLAVAVPSFALLYSIDELIDPAVTLKIVGHQWYWSYEYSDFVTLSGGQNLNFDSYMISTSDLKLGRFRLLEVDNRVYLPVNTHIRLLVTAADVLHSWAIPSFGVKVDACPGRLTQASLYIKREGLFFGQCSEICGINHGFMPIVVKSVKKSVFERWIIRKIRNTHRFSVVYDLLSTRFNKRIRLKIFTNEITAVKSSTKIFSASGWWEREIWDLFGVYFEDHSDLRRILTDYGFDGHPLRKDFPLSGYSELKFNLKNKQLVLEPVEFSQEFRNFKQETQWI
eukprot:gene16532-34450_t